MSGLYYSTGVAFAILAGVSTYLGLAFQKKAVNRIPVEKRGKGFMKTLVKSPLWVLGLILYIGLATIFYMIAQYMIGPALVPGIMVSGLIVLVFAASRIVGEKLALTEVAGIILVLTGALFIAASALVIDSSNINLADTRIILRILFFSFLFLGLWTLSNFLSRKSLKYKAQFKGLAAGFPFCIANFWISVLYASMIPVFSGDLSTVTVTFFIMSSVILVVSNIFGIKEIQSAFKLGAISLVIPIQQIPIQIAPVIYFYHVFMLKTPGKNSIAWILSGMTLIMMGGFMLGKKQETMNSL